MGEKVHFHRLLESFQNLFKYGGKKYIFRDFWKVSRICLNMGEKVHFQRLLESFQNLFKYGGKSTFSETFGKFPEFV